MAEKRKAPDFVLFITVITLLSIGVIMVFSASEYKTLVEYNDSYYYLKKQLMWSLIGLTAMFVMMNAARLAVGVQGVAIAERATQRAVNYARDRRQGRAAGVSGTDMAPIIAHPDVRRMLLTGLCRSIRP